MPSLPDRLSAKPAEDLLREDPSVAVRYRKLIIYGLLVWGTGGIVVTIYPINLLGLFLGLLGACLLLYGRAGTPERARWGIVVGSSLTIALILIGVVSLFVLASVLAASGFSFASGVPDNNPSAISSAFQRTHDAAEYLGVGFSILSGLAATLILFRWTDRAGRALLLAGYGASVSLAVFHAAYMLPIIHTTAIQATTGPTINHAPINRLDDLLILLALAGLIPATLFLTATVRVLLRLRPSVKTVASTPELQG